MIKPNYYDKFQCVAGACTMTCCQEWKIAVDEETNNKWKKIVPPESMQTKKKTLEQFTVLKDGGRVIELEKNQKCPFLNKEKLCKLVMAHGDEILSETCKLFPREIHDFGTHKEFSLMQSCPAVIDLLNKEEKFCLEKNILKQEDVSNEKSEEMNTTIELASMIRQFFIDLVQCEKYTVEKALLMIFYIALDMLENSPMTVEKLSQYRSEETIEELENAIEHVDLDVFYTLEERNELFLDLAVNYRKEGLYQRLLEPIWNLAEEISENEIHSKINIEEINAYLKLLDSYQPLMRKFLASEFFADLYMPIDTEENDCDISDVMEEIVVKLQWIGMEYATICQTLFLHWMKTKELNYEIVREYMVVVCRMTGYEVEDIYEYLENSFEDFVWDWGYFALMIGKM